MKRVRDDTLSYLFTRSPSVLSEGEKVSIEIDGVSLHIGEESIGEGVLRVTTARVTWARKEIGDASLSEGDGLYTLQYPRIVLHAMCRDSEAFPRPCMYLQVTSVGENSEHEDDDEECKTLDVFFAPSNAGVLDELFSAMTRSAELHPDPMEGEEGDGGGGGMFGMGGSPGFDWADSLLAQAGGGEAVPQQFNDEAQP